MKKIFTCTFVVALVFTSTTLCAQQADVTYEAQPVETVIDSQSVVVDGATVEPIADSMSIVDSQALVSDVTYDSGVVTGAVVDMQPAEAFDTSASCDCGQTSLVQPVTYIQPVTTCQSVLLDSLPNQEGQPIYAEGQPIADLAPIAAEPIPSEAATFATAAETQTFASAQAQNFASAPTAAAPRAVATTSACQTCPPTRKSRTSRASRLLRQRGLFARLRNAAISSAINNDN